MSRTHPYLIIGAGPTGLGAAHRLRELGEQDFCVLERRDHAGGLAASFTDDKGFVWDVGGHVQFSHYDHFDALMAEALAEDDWLHHEREAWAWIEGRFVPYPVQNNLRYLRPETQWRCVEGLLAVHRQPPTGPPVDFQDWILRTFGAGLADAFLLPYNAKVWAYPLAELGHQWMGDRIATPDLARVLRNILLRRDDVSWGPNSTFRFPKRGGTGAVWRRLAAQLDPGQLRLGCDVVEVDVEARVVTTRAGERLGFRHLLSTMPLDQLCRMVRPALAPDLVAAAGSLLHSSSHIVGLGLGGQPPAALRGKCWMYFPEADCPFYRATVFSNYSRWNVPDPAGQWSLLTETSESPRKPVLREDLVEDVIRGCLATGLIHSRAEIVSSWHHVADYAYPTPSLDRDRVLDRVLPALEVHGLYSRGRFGAWKYEVSNQDHSAMQGVEWVDRLRRGIPEVTLHRPDVVNAPRRR